MRTVALCQNKKLVLLKSNYFTLTSDVTIYRNEEEITFSLFTMEKDFFVVAAINYNNILAIK